MFKKKFLFRVFIVLFIRENRSLIESMNFKHLYYFWVTARAGGIMRAGEQLGFGAVAMFRQQVQFQRNLQAIVGHGISVGASFDRVRGRVALCGGSCPKRTWGSRRSVRAAGSVCSGRRGRPRTPSALLARQSVEIDAGQRPACPRGWNLCPGFIAFGHGS